MGVLGESLADLGLLNLGGLTRALQAMTDQLNDLRREQADLDRRVTSLEQVLDETEADGAGLRHDTLKLTPEPNDEFLTESAGLSQAVPQGVPSRKGELFIKAAAMAGYKARTSETLQLMEQRLQDLEQLSGSSSLEGRSPASRSAMLAVKALSSLKVKAAATEAHATQIKAAEEALWHEAEAVAVSRLEAVRGQIREQLQGMEDKMGALDACLAARLQDMQLELARESQRSQQVLEGRVKQAEAKASDIRREAKEDRDYCSEAVRTISAMEQRLEEAANAARDALEVSNIARAAAQEPAREAEAVSKTVQAMEERISETVRELHTKVSEATLEVVRKDIEQTTAVHARAIDGIRSRQAQQDAILAQTYRDLLNAPMDAARTFGTNFQVVQRRPSLTRPTTPDNKSSTVRPTSAQAHMPAEQDLAGAVPERTASSSPPPPIVAVQGSRPPLIVVVGSDGNVYRRAVDEGSPPPAEVAAMEVAAAQKPTRVAPPSRREVKLPWPADEDVAVLVEDEEEAEQQASAAGATAKPCGASGGRGREGDAPSPGAARGPGRHQARASSRSTPALHWPSAATISRGSALSRSRPTSAAAARPTSACRKPGTIKKFLRDGEKLSFASYVADKCGPLPALDT